MSCIDGRFRLATQLLLEEPDGDGTMLKKPGERICPRAEKDGGAPSRSDNRLTNELKLCSSMRTL